MSKQLELAYDYIKSRILDGTYKPNQKLVESQLSEEIGVSRNTLKKALLLLEREKLVEIENNKGAIIKSYTLDEILNYLEIREALEAIVVKHAVKNISKSEIEQMEKILDEMRSHIENNRLEEYSARNYDFHAIIYNASTNRQAVQLIELIRTQLKKYHFRTILVPGRNRESYMEHERILKALKSRNEEKVEEAVKNHVANVRKVIERHFHLLS